MLPCKESLLVGSYLIRDVSIRCNPIGADNRHIHLPPGKEETCSVVSDDGVFNILVEQFPGGKPRTLYPWACLVNPDKGILPCPAGSVHRRERASPVDKREPACVAVRQHSSIFLDDSKPVLSYCFARSNIIICDCLRFLHRSLCRSILALWKGGADCVVHPLDSIEEVLRSRSCMTDGICRFSH